MNPVQWSCFLIVSWKTIRFLNPVFVGRKDGVVSRHPRKTEDYQVRTKKARLLDRSPNLEIISTLFKFNIKTLAIS